MANQELQKTLFILTSSSDSILSLPLEKQTQMRERMMSLSDSQMEKIIFILQNEQRKMEPIQRDLQTYGTQIGLLTTNLHMSALKLRRNYAGAIEEEDQAQTFHNNEELLKQLDSADNTKKSHQWF